MKSRRTTLPRQRPTPELNIIQAPELLQRLRERLGVRQAHFLPALAEGVQAVVILDDMTNKAGKSLHPCMGTGIGVNSDGALRRSSVILYNPAGSGKTLRVKSISSCALDSGGAGDMGVQLTVSTFGLTGPAGADFGLSPDVPVFQDWRFRLEGYPDALTQIRNPVGLIFNGRSVSLGVPFHRYIHYSAGDQTKPQFYTPLDLIIQQQLGIVVAIESGSLFAGIRASFQWTEEVA